MKIAYIDVKYHSLTKSNDFFFNIISKHFEAKRFWIETHCNFSSKIFDKIKDEGYDTIILFQAYRDPKWLNKRYGFKNIIWIPMADASGEEPITTFKTYTGYKIIAFSDKILTKSIIAGVNTLKLKYFCWLKHFKEKEFNNLKIFFWYRRKTIDFPLIKKLFKNYNIEKIYIHNTPDPIARKKITLNKKDIEKFNIIIGKWFPTKDDYYKKLDEYNIFIAPRVIEGIGLSFLEAMSRGLIVVSNNNVTMNEYIKNFYNGILFDIYLPQPIKKIPPYEFHRMSKNSLKFQEKGFLEWINSEKRIIDFIEKDSKIRVFIPEIEKKIEDFPESYLLLADFFKKEQNPKWKDYIKKIKTENLNFKQILTVEKILDRSPINSFVLNNLELIKKSKDSIMLLLKELINYYHKKGRLTNIEKKVILNILNSNIKPNTFKEFFVLGRIYHILKDYNIALKFLNKARKLTNNKRRKSEILFLISEIKRSTNKNSWRYYIKKAKNLSSKIKRKTTKDMYQIASAYKKLNDLNKAKYWFKRIIKIGEVKLLESGAYFHLGEIEYESGNINRALNYFKKCLTLNPEHKKAKEYMEKIGNKKTVSISLITTCKGRLKYLKESLPSWLALDYDNYDIIIVDYDDPDGTEEYIKKNREKLLSNSKAKDIKVVKVKNKPLFNLNDARNRGIDFSNSELIFMIDSDVHIKNKLLLKKINKLYKKGFILFTSQMILNTNYKEIILLYKDYYDIELNIPLLLPIGTPKKGFNGTACFLKKIYNEVKKFNTEINKYGYGQDENEFFLRYINYYFKNYYFPNKKNKDVVKNLDNVLNHFYTFSIKDFYVVENKKEEKSKYYSLDISLSFEFNKKFIHKYFTKVLNNSNKGNFCPTGNLIDYSTLKFNKVNNKTIPQNLRQQILAVLSRYFSRIGEINKAILLHKKLLKNRVLTTQHKFFLYLELGDILKKLNKIEYKKYYKKALSLVNKKGEEIRISPNLAKANLFFKLNEHTYAKKYAKRSLLENNVPAEKAWAYTLLSKLEPQNQKKYIKLSIEQLLKKKYLFNKDIIKITNNYFKIGDIKRSEIWAKKVLNRKNVSFNYKISALMILGDIYSKKDKNKAQKFYNDAIKIIIESNEQSILNIQKLASLYKRKGDFNKSKQLFKKLLRTTNDKLLISGAYFHLGEIELELNHKKEAIQYFKKCLELNPEHRKAKEYIEKLTE